MRLSARRRVGAAGRARGAAEKPNRLGWVQAAANGGMVLTGMKLPVPTLIKRYAATWCSACTPHTPIYRPVERLVNERESTAFSRLRPPGSAARSKFRSLRADAPRIKGDNQFTS